MSVMEETEQKRVALQELCARAGVQELRAQVDADRLGDTA